MRILLDADAYIAIYSENDASHKKAVEIAKRSRNRKDVLFTTTDVIDETATKLSYHVSKKKALDFLKDLAVVGTEIIYSDEDSLGKVADKFEEIRSKNVSFTDCVNMVFYEEYSIDRIFSFDKIYSKQGLKLLS